MDGDFWIVVSAWGNWDANQDRKPVIPLRDVGWRGVGVWRGGDGCVGGGSGDGWLGIMERWWW